VIDEGQAWLLDAGPDFRRHLALLAHHDARLAGIMLTHGHIGHYTGLMYLGREAMDTTRLPVWAAPRLAAFIAANGPWEQLVTAGNIDLQVVHHQQPIELSAHVTATAFPVPHRDEYSETVGYRVAGPDQAIVYVPDTDSWDNWETPIEDHLAGSDVALLDATFYDASELPGRDVGTIAHPFVADSLQRFSALPDSERAKIHFTHLNHTNPLLDASSTEYIRVVRTGMSVATEGAIHRL
jgi:pyrroloquinoline quinone biosynthesis protein B